MLIRRESLRTNLIFAAIVVAGLALDLSSKSYVKSRHLETPFRSSGVVVIPGCFNILFRENAGGVFGIGQGKAALFVAFTVVALGVLTWLFLTTDRSQPHLNIGLALITAGAMGNLYDRVFNAGKVRDFIDWYIGRYHWYTFNLADACICIGVGLLMLDILLAKPRDVDAAEQAEEAGETRPSHLR